MMTPMQNDFKEDAPNTPIDLPETSSMAKRERNVISVWMSSLLQMGLGESMLKAGTNILSLLAIVIVIWLVQIFYRQSAGALGLTATQPQGPAATAMVDLASIPALDNPATVGVLRGAQLHTNIPSRPRQDITTYTVQAGDTVSGIAEKFGLQPKTIFAANFALLQDNPHWLMPDQELKILPVDGVYWEWLGGITFGAWAEYYKVKPEDIINYPANHLDAVAVGDPANANIAKGTMLIVPGGEYQYHSSIGQLQGISRNNPASAQVGGAGACPAVSGGAVGTGTFVYPTPKHVLSGFDYSVKTNHLGIDLMGNLGDSVYATDSGVIVYVGWNDYGYGNMIMVDHGNFQSLYGHLSAMFVSCGENVTQGQTIGAIGSTGRSSGPHLHFEVRTTSTVINPWDVLPPP
jgi:murein DD-endopeptidase MepM/ murein hydrolase activator NlpD